MPRSLELVNGGMLVKLTDLHELYRENVQPAMVDVLAEQVQVGRESLLQLEVGWIPKGNLWTFPERDATGRVIGLVCRTRDGRKFTVKGSKRGLTYAVEGNTDGYDPRKQRWERVTVESPCPICGRTKFCGVDATNNPPRIVRCTKESINACYGPDREGAFIHELVPGSFKPYNSLRRTAPLAPSDKPIIVVEGQTDCAAAMDLGFVAIGRPSATGGLSMLATLLQGRKNVAIIGENDAGVGREGMERAFETLRSKCSEVVKLMPPEGIKDLRDWVVKEQLTTQSFLDIIRNGDTETDPNTMEDDASAIVATLWLREHLG